jgi:hypothetical protein
MECTTGVVYVKSPDVVVVITGVVIETLIAPAECAAVLPVIVVSSTTLKDVILLPSDAFVAPRKNLPEIVIGVLPEVVPELGETPVITGPYLAFLIGDILFLFN